MSASAWDRAVEAGVSVILGEPGGSGWSATELSDRMLTAALPVLLEELAQRIEAQEKPDDVEGSRVMGWLIGRSDSAKIVREFAAEVTKKAGP